MKAYSLDLRQKIVDAYAGGDISQRKLAKNFGVTLSFVQNLLKRHRELGTIVPKVRTEQTPKMCPRLTRATSLCSKAQPQRKKCLGNWCH